MIVRLSEEISDLYNFLAENESDDNLRSEFLSTAKSFMKIRNDIKEAMNNFLWDKVSDDHYITELNPDGSTR